MHVYVCFRFYLLFFMLSSVFAILFTHSVIVVVRSFDLDIVRWVFDSTWFIYPKLTCTREYYYMHTENDKKKSNRIENQILIDTQSFQIYRRQNGSILKPHYIWKITTNKILLIYLNVCGLVVWVCDSWLCVMFFVEFIYQKNACSIQLKTKN